MRTESERDEDDRSGLADEATPRARLVREQAASIAHYKKMYDRASALARIGVWECDLATGKLTWTDGVYDLFELPRGAALDRAEVVSLYDEESRLEMERLRAAAIEAGSGFSLDIRIRTARGNERWLHLTADIEQEDGRAVRIFGTKQDVTRAKAAQEEVRSLQAELIQASRRSAMGAMAATLAHELNQPLAAISNYAAGLRRALERAAPERGQLESGLEAIEGSAFRASTIIRSLRDITNGSAVARQPLDPNPLLREAGALATSRPGDRLGLAYDLAEGIVVLADAVQVQQVFINLIRNAAEAVRGAPRREIRVSTAPAGDMVEIRVDDSGPGIAPGTLATLFDSAASSKPDGMGVGLAISRTIVEAHGGTLSAANLPGGGASFRATLPLSGD